MKQGGYQIVEIDGSVFGSGTSATIDGIFDLVDNAYGKRPLLLYISLESLSICVFATLVSVDDGSTQEFSHYNLEYFSTEYSSSSGVSITGHSIEVYPNDLVTILG